MKYDSKSYLIDGKRVFINSAAIHYFRMPREEWRDVLLKAKLAGMNCVDTYFAWNFHEPSEGEWRFEGDFDCGAFLELCGELGLWVIARPGPYICAEWDFGGLPWWLNSKDGIQYRSENSEFLRAVDRYFDRIVPILADKQWTNGGPVILVQVENEYLHQGSDEQGRGYLNYLRDGLIARGIRVPLISCHGGVEGTVEGANFWSGAEQQMQALQKKQPDTPKLVTEFWTGWFEHWGAERASQKTPALLAKRIMEIIRAGYDGISHYMFFGGTNFGGYGGRTVGGSDVFMVTSYDYDAPLDEYGRVTDKYRVSKRLNYFIQAIGEFLLESERMDAEDVRVPTGCNVSGRRWQDQRLYLVENALEERATFPFTLTDGRTLTATVNPGEIVPVLVDYEIVPGSGIRITCNSFLACNEQLDGVHTVIVYSGNGQRSQLSVRAAEAIQYTDETMVGYTFRDEGCTIDFDLYHYEETQTHELIVGNREIRFIVMNTDAIDHTWMFDRNGQRRLFAGYSEIGFSQGRWIGAPRVSEWQVAPSSLSNWRQSRLDLSSLAFSVTSRLPIDFSGLGQAYGYVVYAFDVESEEGGMRTLIAPCIQDTFRVYVNGVEQELVRDVYSAAFTVRLSRGTNIVHLLVQNMGRYNFSFQLGEKKGLSSPVYADGRAVDIRRDWTMGGMNVHLDEVNPIVGSPAIARTFHVKGHDRALLVGAVGSGIVVNGHSIDLSHYPTWYQFYSVDISEYLREGENRLEMAYDRSPISRLELFVFDSKSVIQAYKMASIDTGDVPAQWEPIASEERDRGPTWFMCTFDNPIPPGQDHAKAKLRLTGMSKGQIWLNGHNLGRYWQIGPQEDYKIPVSMLQHENRLVLFDEEGRRPDRVRLMYDDGAVQRWYPVEVPE